MTSGSFGFAQDDKSIYREGENVYPIKSMKPLSLIFALLISLVWTLPSVAAVCNGCATEKMSADCQEKKRPDEENSSSAKMDCHKAKSPKLACEGKKKKDEDQSTIEAESNLACHGCCCLTPTPVARASFEEALPEFRNVKIQIPFVVISAATLQLPRISHGQIFLKSPPDLKRDSTEILTFKQSFLI